jgi:Domain of unknown function (DUF4145)
VTKEPIPLLYLGGAVMADMPADEERFVQERVTVFECLGCHERTAVIEELTIGNKPSGGKFRGGGTMRFRGVNWWPPASGASVDASVPDRVRGIFGEGLRCLSAKAPNAAAVMFGRTLEAIVHDKGGEKAVKALDVSLAAALGVMVAEGRLSQDLADWAKEVRLGRNAGGHDEPLDKLDDVTPEEARNLSKFLDQLLVNLYVMPARLRRAKGPTPPNA